MKKIWLEGKAYLLTDEQVEEMNAYAAEKAGSEPKKSEPFAVEYLRGEGLLDEPTKSSKKKKNQPDA